MIKLFSFLFIMWILILLGGAVAIILLNPLSISGYGELDYILTTITKTILAIFLIILWIILLTKIKNSLLG